MRPSEASQVKKLPHVKKPPHVKRLPHVQKCLTLEQVLRRLHIRWWKVCRFRPLEILPEKNTNLLQKAGPFRKINFKLLYGMKASSVWVQILIFSEAEVAIKLRNLCLSSTNFLIFLEIKLEMGFVCLIQWVSKYQNTGVMKTAACRRFTWT